MNKDMHSEYLQIQKHRILEILNDATLYSNDKLNLDQTSHNARQIIAALSGMLPSQDEEIANLLAVRIGLSPSTIDNPLLKVPA